MKKQKCTGKVYLIGAGPGDPGLITVKGLECLKKADAVVYDALVNPVLISQAKEDAVLINAGKRGNKHILEQEEINKLLLRLARKGMNVARLKGGDPCLFGRGGEEAEFLAKYGIGFEIVPGITSAIAAPVYAGIPVTHRKFGSMYTVVTGHAGETNHNSYEVDWSGISPHSTLVVLMGMGKLKDITRELIDSGWDSQTPAAVIQWGTLPHQRTVKGTMVNIAAKVKKAGITAPAVTIFGKVVSMRDVLRWWR